MITTELYNARLLIRTLHGGYVEGTFGLTPHYKRLNTCHLECGNFRESEVAATTFDIHKLLVCFYVLSNVQANTCAGLPRNFSPMQFRSQRIWKMMLLLKDGAKMNHYESKSRFFVLSN